MCDAFSRMALSYIIVSDISYACVDGIERKIVRFLGVIASKPCISDQSSRTKGMRFLGCQIVN